MRLNQKTSRLVAEMEYLIGSECFNSSSYREFYNMNRRAFRYPITLQGNTLERHAKNATNYTITQFTNKDFTRYSGDANLSQILEKVTPDDILNMSYKFGANELFIGRGIVKVLAYLEDRYDLDFNELERERKKKK